MLIRRGSRVAQSGLRRIRCGKDGLIPHLEGMARLAIVLVALAGLLLLRFVSKGQNLPLERSVLQTKVSAGPG